MTTDKILVLPEEISIANISQWHSELSDLLQQSSSIDIAASDLSRLDTAAVQLLSVFSNAAWTPASILTGCQFQAIYRQRQNNWASINCCLTILRSKRRTPVACILVVDDSALL